VSEADLFDDLMERYGRFDYVIGQFRWRGYHDGGWLEGYDIEPVIYWGA
jgi:hypothetical protein